MKQVPPDVAAGMNADADAPRFTAKQGQYLPFIYAYTLVIGRSPAESDAALSASADRRCIR